ncbi:glycogen debranching protein GlgX [Nakamurella sp.]|uniref:glycogen debranching protein GlgX n=1 Tax=Nakamurella sp. TaxID=1869182 RepID=UPI003B3ADB1B
MELRARPGRPFPLGVHLQDGGASVAVYSSVADAVDLCLFDERGAETRVPLPGRDDGIWHGFVPGLEAGQLYGFRVHGPWDPATGRRANPAKLLLDPYARAISGAVTVAPAAYGYDAADPRRPSGLDSAPVMPRSVLVAPTGGADPARRPGHHLNDSVIYEIHVKGFTARHPDVPPALRGTYAGLAHPAAIDHLRRLGVTAVELLPVHHHVSEPVLAGRGLTNYWGYNTIGYLAPHADYSAAVRAGRPGGQVAEFRDMVAALHAAGIEVILDVVYNHTAEGDAGGPTIGFRGLDNAAYYRLDPADPARYIDTSGCGNALNVGNPTCLRLIMDSLRYWVTEMGVDGFRFDLAPSLARQDGSFSRLAAFFDLVWQDPVITQVKLIAEPWDVGQGDSYDVGRFPPGWSEWNGRFRDTVRDLWRSHDGLLPDLATRLAGSSDLYGPRRRGPDASINLVTVHDGFTLTDLVSYDRKHNEANTEHNRDGTDDNRSWNCGVEGPTSDPQVAALRDRQRRALLSTLLLARGVPLLLGGDELGRTQGGNNNAYCQDNEITWFDWSAVDTSLRDFTADLIALRHAHPALRRRGYPVHPDAVRWFRPDGAAMAAPDWANPEGKSIAMVVSGTLDADLADDGTPMLDDDLAVVINAWWEPETFALTWDAGPAVVESDSHDPGRAGTKVDGALVVGPRSVVLLRCG